MPRHYDSNRNTPPRGSGSSSPSDPPPPLNPASSPLSLTFIPLSPAHLAMCFAPNCEHEESDPDRMVAHLRSQHAKRLYVSVEMERAYAIPRTEICPGCRVLYLGMKKHLGAKI